MNILLAEDNEANRLLVQALLERDGHQLYFAENGKVALEMCKVQKFDLILMDILMPVLDGVRAMRHLRRSGGQNAKTPVFAFTAYSSADDKRRYRQVGFDRVLKKPLKPGGLDKAWANFKTGGDLFDAPSPREQSQSFKNIELINPAMINKLFEVGSIQDILHIISRFRESISEKQIIIHAHLPYAEFGQMQDLDTVRQAAHAIKGASTTLGLSRVSLITARLRNAPPDSLRDLINALDIAIDRSLDAMNYILKAKGTNAKDTKADFVEVHSNDVNARIASGQTRS